MKLSPKAKSALLSYLRAGVASVVTLLMAGYSSPKDLSIAFLGAFAGPALKYVDKSSKEFGLTK